jgi:hypothetical protein
MTRVALCLVMAVLLHVPGLSWKGAEIATYLAQAGGN